MTARLGIRISRGCFFIVLSLILSLGLAGCGKSLTKYPSRTPAPPASKKQPLSGKSYVINGRRYHVLASAAGFTQEGEASWYGGKFHGRKTASGERYNMHGLTAAHKTLPLQTWVKVTNLANHRELTVRVNDRGPFVRGRIIDLSRAGARKLGMLEAGTVPVRIVALGVAREKKINGRTRTVLVQPRSYQEGRFGVQVGSFRNRDNARALAAKLRREYGLVTIQVFDRGDAVFYRVLVSDRKTIGQALSLQSRLERQGYKDCFVVAR
ncbi:MAG: septal ring lytic transglycosylase RlpA family protein [Thermodesulfobacteriota bacterium]|nr:septal ring lytic transglycosylase RlpA family protein [Thermodesulfobacteriota bacterium]